MKDFIKSILLNVSVVIAGGRDSLQLSKEGAKGNLTMEAVKKNAEKG